jgi:hypothetical protein
LTRLDVREIEHCNDLGILGADERRAGSVADVTPALSLLRGPPRRMAR